MQKTAMKNNTPVLKARAKLNLGLTIPYRYQNGYHHLVSCFLPVSLADKISIEATPRKIDLNREATEQIDPEYRFSSELPTAFTEQMKPAFAPLNRQNNLMTKAFNWFCSLEEPLKKAGFTTQAQAIAAIYENSYSIAIEKNIPSPGGFGGGSSDAAAIIRYLTQKYFVAAPAHKDAELLNFIADSSSQLGSDIPFFLSPVTSMGTEPAIISGTYQISHTVSLPAMQGVIGIPAKGSATTMVYKQLREAKKPLHGDKHANYALSEALGAQAGLIKDIVAKLETGTEKPGKIKSQVTRLPNDFIEVIEQIDARLHSSILAGSQTAVEAFLELAAVAQTGTANAISSMTGSGSGFYLLWAAASEIEAEKLAAMLKERAGTYSWWAVYT